MSFKTNNVLVVLIILSGSFLIYSGLIEPHWIQVTEIEISQEPFASFFKAHKTVFISDLHVSELGVREQKLLQAVAQIDPDIILIVGDSTPWGGGYERTFEFLSRLRAREGVWGVLGDSDYQNARKSCRFCHAFNPGEEPLPVRFLQNQAVKPYGEAVAIAGLDMFPLDQDERRTVRDDLVTRPTVLLSQKQVKLEDLPDKPVLVLSGDTHGGQVWMPEWLWRLAFAGSKGGVRKSVLRQGDKVLVVSSGVGVNAWPFRLFAPPEVVFFK